MRSFFKTMFAGMIGTFLALTLIGVVAISILIIAVSSNEEDTDIKEKSILHLQFKDQISDRSSSKPDLSTFSISTKQGLTEIIETIHRAKEDKKIKGIYLDLGIVPAGMATVEEVRNALLDFKKAGKFIVSHADYYTHKSYYLASVADSLYLTPEGEIQFTGLSAQIMFFKTILEKVGIEPEIIRHGKFKSAIEPFMLDSISPANREQTLTYMGSIWKKILTGIKEERGISIDTLNSLADNLRINSGTAALKNKMIDGLLYNDQVTEVLKRMSGIEKKQKLNLVTVSQYSGSEEEKSEKEFSTNKIAVIYALGEIGMGKGDDETIGSETLSKAIREAREDSSIKAIVLRINSPGGSALASEVIWRETVLAKKAKPFIVSMGDVAASGGYYIACMADTIVAQPNTITGSIGVFGLLFNAKKLMKEVGVNISVVQTNKYADIGSPMRKMTTYERNVIQKGVEDIYKTFITHVSEGRGMTVAQIDSIGQGRVWSGENAIKIGLVDMFGGLDDAIRIASEKAKILNYRIKTYPEKGKYDEIIEGIMKEAKVSTFESEMGEYYQYYKNIKQVKNMKGIQARLPYFLEIN